MKRAELSSILNRFNCMDRKTKAIFSQIMREIGRKGGQIGGKRSLETMTPDERSARAKKAAEAAAKADGRAAGVGAQDETKQACTFVEVPCNCDRF